MTKPQVHQFQHTAMSTEVAVLVAGCEREYARQAGQAFFQEVDRVAGLLNRYAPASDIARLNRLPPGGSLRVSLETWQCLQLAQQVSAATCDLFEVTVGPLVSLWKAPHTPTPDQLATARARVGLHRIILREDSPGAYAVQLAPDAPAEGVVVDLGGIGKGFVLDCALPVFTDWELENVLVHAGTSTACARGSSGQHTNCAGWQIGVGGEWSELLGFDRVCLRDHALSGSGTAVKGGHIINPRTGRPEYSIPATWVRAPTGAWADACSTALALMTPDQCAALFAHHTDLAGIVIDQQPVPRARVYGKWDRQE